MTIFDKLMAVRRVKFVDGEISLLDQRVVISPVELLTSVTEILIDQPKLVPVVYEKNRLSFSMGFADAVHELYGFKPRDFITWLIDLSDLCGWGKHELVDFDSEKLGGTLRFRNSPVASHFKGKVKGPIDHLWRGLTAAGATRIFGVDTDFVEESCMAIGDPYCEFHFKPRKSFTKTELKKYRGQLPI